MAHVTNGLGIDVIHSSVYYIYGLGEQHLCKVEHNLK